MGGWTTGGPALTIVSSVFFKFQPRVPAREEQRQKERRSQPDAGDDEKRTESHKKCKRTENVDGGLSQKDRQTEVDLTLVASKQDKI